MFIVFALVIVVMFLAGSKRAPHDSGWWINFGCMCVFVFNGVLLWPLMLLRALRAWVPPMDDTRGFEVVTKKDAGAAAD